MTCYPGQMLNQWRADHRDSDDIPFVRRLTPGESNTYDPSRAAAEAAAMRARVAQMT